MAPMPDYPSAEKRIGKNLRYLRLHRGHDQLCLARVLGVHRTVITRIECGRRPLRYSEAVLLAERFAFDLDELEDGCPIGF